MIGLTGHDSMKNTQPNFGEEFEELTEGIAEVAYELDDGLKIGKMLYAIAEEKKSNNLVVREINSKFDQMINKLDRVATLLESMQLNQGAVMDEAEEEEFLGISDRDEEILDFVKSHKRVNADDVQNHFKYRGRNAASARLNKLFRDELLEKVYAGRNVYYSVKQQ